MTCKTCNGSIEPGTLHACQGSSLQAPWLEAMLTAANRPLLDELAKIRVLLERSPEDLRKPMGKADRRETR
jgi:hypothetical protein